MVIIWLRPVIVYLRAALSPSLLIQVTSASLNMSYYILLMSWQLLRYTLNFSLNLVSRPLEFLLMLILWFVLLAAMLKWLPRLACYVLQIYLPHSNIRVVQDPVSQEHLISSVIPVSSLCIYAAVTLVTYVSLQPISRQLLRNLRANVSHYLRRSVLILCALVKLLSQSIQNLKQKVNRNVRQSIQQFQARVTNQRITIGTLRIYRREPTFESENQDTIPMSMKLKLMAVIILWMLTMYKILKEGLLDDGVILPMMEDQTMVDMMMEILVVIIVSRKIAMLMF
nr:MAG: hypothetical protein 2 [Solemoviridae sp.]